MRWWKSIVRWLVMLIFVTSLALTAAWTALWIRTYSVSDAIHFASPHGGSVAYTCRGGVVLLTQPFARPTEWEWDRAEFGNEPEPFQAGLGPGEEIGLGIRHDSYFTSMANNAWAVAVPIRLFVVASALPAVALLLGALLKRIVRPRRGRGFELLPPLHAKA
jgi:hypothetical protein